MSRSPHTDDRIDAHLAVAGFYREAELPVPLSVSADLMRDGVFESIPFNRKDNYEQ